VRTKNFRPPAEVTDQQPKHERKPNMTKTNPGVIETVRDQSIAAIKGTGNIVEKTVDTAAKIVTTTAKDTAKVGGEVGTAATGLVVGVVEDVKQVGVKAEHATAAVAGGALKAVGEVGSAAVDAVRATVTKPSNHEAAGKKEPTTAASRN
jgi:hypothetical protein